MQNNIQIIDRIKSTYATLRPSEQRVADYVLNHVEQCAKSTIAEIAQHSQVSQPTVIRFIKALGIDRYRNFKYALLRDEKNFSTPAFTHFGNFDLKPWDRLEDLPLREIQSTRELLEDTLKFLSPESLHRATEALACANLINIYSVENSSTPANDLLTKLTYLGLHCQLHTDAYLQQISAIHLNPGDVAIAFSHSGYSIDTVTSLKLARKAGATTIAVTSVKTSLLPRYADICLCAGSEKSVIYGSAIFSRIPDLAVVDLLYMGIIQSDYERFSRNLDKSGAVIANRGYPAET
ncbi:MAG: MurR/RpiR family transcriptional regulator [Eubacteriales bacterium]|jgi:DNA-binding MurR/RpiR family transcriptional regulator